VVAGLVQVPPSGDPVLLMADRQTTGGYPAVAVVIAADLPRAAQLGPGDRLVFESCNQDAALQALLAIERTLLAIDGS
jgi:allophanate hydrolase subunit 2